MVSYIAEILLVSDVVLSVFIIVCINGILKTTQVVVNSLITRSQHNDQSGIKINVSVNINGYI